MAELKYGNWKIYHDPPPIPSRSFDWNFWHEDFDGAPDSGDIRCGAGPSVEDCEEQIDELERILEARRNAHRNQTTT